jgi:hypothetical protein
MVLIFLADIFGASFTRRSRSHHNQSSSENQYQSGVDKISNATLSDASMPANTPNVTENQNICPSPFYASEDASALDVLK